MILKFFFIITLLFIIIYLNKNKIEGYQLELVTGNNLFTAKINNIFYNDYNINLPYINNTNEVIINPDNDKPKIESIQEISNDVIENSKTNIQKKICESYKNQALCWENQKCQWDNNLNNSKCIIATTMLL